MKTNFFLLGILFLFNGSTVLKPVESKVYSFSTTKMEKTVDGGKCVLISGETVHLKNFEILACTLSPGKVQKQNQGNPDQESILLVREGQLRIALKDSEKVVPEGSLALIMPGDKYRLGNSGKSDLIYYQINYTSRKPVDFQRGKTAGGSMLLDWNNIQFKPHDKGGARRYFDRKSDMSEKVEIHVTSLNVATKSHDPHTHIPEEIIIMMKGSTEMEIGSGIFSGKPGDIYFLGSNIPHGIRNTGSEQCMYLAFQWE